MKHTLYIFIAFVAAQLTAMPKASQKGSFAVGEAGAKPARAFESVATTAQKDLVLFDTKDYEAVGVYDAWENSPFRDGRLEGNAAIVDNPYTDIDDEFLGYAPNTSPKVLAVQRSRYGSNQFGARIDLTEPFALSPTMQYVHVLIHRPVGGRVMLIGLGKHRESEWSSQSKETEQLWVLSSSAVTPGKWADAVFAVQGVSGVDIYSLVVVPECESPHDRTDDFVAYIDQITLSSSSTPVVQYEDYPTNFNKTDTYASRTDRGILSVALQGVQTLAITSSPATSDPLYRNRTETAFAVKAGQSVKPVFGYKGSWMCGYAYVDYGRDGKFSFDINTDGTPAEGSDLVSYSAYNQRNSLGRQLSDNNTLDMPAFTVPEATAYGFYHMRFKVDWNEIDPAGAETIKDNGGGIVDIRLNVHPDYVSVAEDNRNGEILAADGSSLPATTPFGQSLTIKLNPENGFAYNGVRIRHGYNLTGDSLVHSTPQYVDHYAYRDKFDDSNCLTIPAEWVDGDLMLEGLFVEKGTEMNFDYTINFEEGTTFSRTDRHLNSVTMAGTTAPIPNDRILYHKDMAQTFFARPQQSLTANFGYTGNWMNGYVYVDCNRDGKFSFDINTNGTPAEGSDLMAYSHAGGKNSKGATTNGNTLQPPAFTLPDIADGFYRLRFKVDWDCLDPGGNTSEANMITANGGGIADYRLRIYSGDEVQVSVAECQNGYIRAMGGIAMPATTAYRQPLPMLAVPFDGHRLDTLYVTHGDLTGQAIVHSVPQRLTEAYTSQDLTGDLLMLPASIVDGDLLLRATFVIDDAEPTGLENENENSNLKSQTYYDLQGRKINPHSSSLKSQFIIKDRKIIYTQ